MVDLVKHDCPNVSPMVNPILVHGDKCPNCGLRTPPEISEEDRELLKRLFPETEKISFTSEQEDQMRKDYPGEWKEIDRLSAEIKANIKSLAVPKLFIAPETSPEPSEVQTRRKS